MSTKFISIGYGSVVSSDKIIAIVGLESAPIKRMVQDARESGKLIDATYGRKTRSVIIMDSDHLVLSGMQPETVANRVSGKTSDKQQDNGDK